jgi:DeoR/GlpR family transcriptional regulator of sugar metabolism
MVTIGPIGFPGTQGIRADVAVIGVGGISVEHGLSTTNLHEAQMMRQMIESSSRVVVVADSSKFGRSNFVHICDLADISTLVTERAPGPELQAALQDTGVEVVYAPMRNRPDAEAVPTADQRPVR